MQGVEKSKLRVEESKFKMWRRLTNPRTNNIANDYERKYFERGDCKNQWERSESKGVTEL